MRIFGHLISPFILGLLLGWFPSSTFADTTKNPQQHWHKPFLVIYQVGADPTLTDPKFNLPWGLVAAVWDDGWVIRAKNEKLVGKTYFEGYAEKLEFQKFYRTVVTPEILNNPDTFLVSIDDPYRIIIIRAGGKKHEWTRGVSNDEDVFREIEARTWRLPLEKPTVAPSKDWNRLKN